MKILIAHNAYQIRGGEDVVVDAEMKLLRDAGHRVTAHLRHNDEIGRNPLAAVPSVLWSRRTVSALERLFEEDRPDLVHVHNSFPLISPSLHWVAQRWHVPVVQTLHNFRMLCPQAMLLRDGRSCEACVGKLPWRAAVHGCYRNSPMQSAVLAGMLMAHQALGTWQHKVTRYVVPSEFCRRKFIEGGLAAERILVKPHFTRRPPQTEPGARRGGLYVGRLAPEKGVQILLEALQCDAANDLREVMRVAGCGPLQDAVAARLGERFMGSITLEQVEQAMQQAEWVVVPSATYETFGLTVIEAFANGTPVIASGHGSLAELVVDGETGLLVPPGDARALAERMHWARSHPEAMRRMGENARAEWERLYTPERNYRLLMQVYEEAIAACAEVVHATA